MVGIYKITNQINGHCYIGQSVNIEKRWKSHIYTSTNKKDKGYNYPLYMAIRKYGIQNFSFEIIEECSQLELDKKEIYWIEYYNSFLAGYNQNEGGKSNSHGMSLTPEEVIQIKKLLKESKLSNKEIGEIFNVSGKDTIRDINNGRTWFDEKEKYPLRISKYDSRYKRIPICHECGKEISKGAEYCRSCLSKIQKEKNRNNLPITREELKDLIRNKPFTTIGKQFKVSDNAIRKWCKNFNLPFKKTDINSYSDKEWDLI